MEYLMTYGWALLVIVIVVAILLVMNPFAAPQSCRFDQIGFTCEAPALSSAGQLFVRIANGNNNAVRIKGVVCTNVRTNTPPEQPAGTTAVLIPRQGVYEVNSTDNKVSCTGASSTKGTDFSGKVWVFYNNEEDGADYPVRTASATLVTKVV